MRLLACVPLAVPLLACSFEPMCPNNLEDLSDPAVRDRFGAGLVAGTAIEQRYVDSPDPDFRGYDINITFRGVGLAEADQVMFVAAQSPIPDVQPGVEVLVVGGRGPRAAEIQSMGCSALVPLNSSQ
jgi:hypothetical protein